MPLRKAQPATSIASRRYRDAAFYRTVCGLSLSSLGIGTYMGGDDDAADEAYTDALIAAGLGGINLFDTAINYRNQRSERCIGAALRQLQRDEIAVCTKAGFLTPGAIPGIFKARSTWWARCTAMHPDFLADQIDRSRANLGVDTIDVFYLHNPETQLGFLTREEFDARIRGAFGRLEQLVADRKIRWYGAATWDGFRRKGALDLPRMSALALEECGPEHHFRFIQLPFNLGMVEAFLREFRRGKARKHPAGGGATGYRGGCQRHALAGRGARTHAEGDGRTAARLEQRAARDSVYALHPGRRGGAGGDGPDGSRARKPRRGARRPGHARTISSPVPVMTAIEVGEDLAQLDAAIAELPDQPAVFLLWAKEGEPYLSRTGVLRRRLRRLLTERERPSRLLNLRHTVARIEYRLTGSAFESSILFYEQARRHFPDTYLRLMKLHMPPYVKLVLNNEFPRSHITTHLTRAAGLYFGPFRSRASAERFEAQFLDLFQMRRCQEDLVPSPSHPGCIYGEMGMCLRPCQQVVGRAGVCHRNRARRRVPAHGRAVAVGIHRTLAGSPEPGDAVRGRGAAAQAL